MRVLLDTNILIHREAATVVREGIGSVFYWLDHLHYEKWIHPVSPEEINKHEDERVRRSFREKLSSYPMIRSLAPITPEIQAIIDRLDQNENDRNDSKILNELAANRVDLLITEDGKIHDKARSLNIQDKVYSIDSFLEKVVSENPNLVDYRVLSVQKVMFGSVDVNEPFFDSFRADYPGFNEWFDRKASEYSYVCRINDHIAAFLFLKVETTQEPYPEIDPTFSPKRRLKIGTLKVESNGLRLGERFLKIVFDNAIVQSVDEIYVTIFDHTDEHKRLINLLKEFGFVFHGMKNNTYGAEQVYVRVMSRSFNDNDPAFTFPFMKRANRAYIVPIYPDYHTSLFPDSILKTESPDDFVENEPHRNAIRKAYVSHSKFRELERGDIIVFYRTGGYHKSVVTTLGIVENVHDQITNELEFIAFCRKRSVFTNQELQERWRRYPSYRPFVVDFLYAYSFPRRPTMAALIDNGVISGIDAAPRGFERITREQFETILRLSETDTRIIVD